MGAYLVRRIFYVLPTLIGVTLITFTLFNIFGGDPAIQQAGKHATKEQIEIIKHELGLDLPLHKQYFAYLGQIVSLDFGRSWSSKQQISEMIFSGIGASLSLTVPAFFFAVILCLILAMLSAYYRGRWFDKAAVIYCLAGLSVSSLVYILVGQYVFGYQLGVFPISGWDASWVGRWPYLILPASIFVVLSIGSDLLLYRSVILEENFQDYVRTARAKGLGNRKVYMKHILRNALIPIITVVALEMPFLYTGSLLLESFFGIPGLGGMMVQALFNSDFPVIKAMTFIGAVMYMFFRLVADVLSSAADPRVQFK